MVISQMAPNDEIGCLSARAAHGQHACGWGANDSGDNVTNMQGGSRGSNSQLSKSLSQSTWVVHVLRLTLHSPVASTQ